MMQKQVAKQSSTCYSTGNSPIKILAIDTSSSMTTAALTVDEKVVAESAFSTDRTLSVRLIPEIERLLAFSGIEMIDIDLFAASTGPGSFTGVRGGVATIQGLALATGKPCAGYSSLAMLAMNFPLSSCLVCPLLDARKSEIYAGLYDVTSPIPVPVINDSVMPPELFFDLIRDMTDKPVIFAGEGALRYLENIISCFGDSAVIAPFPQHTSRASNGALLALHAFRKGKQLNSSELLPVYLRASDAEINRKSSKL